MATIRKRNSRWEAQIRIKGFPTLTKTFTAHADAIAWSKENERSIERSELPVSIREMRGITLADLLKRYEDEVLPLKRGCAKERYKLNVVRRHPVALVSIDKLTGQNFAKYRDDRLLVVATGTVRRELAILRHCLEVARKEWSMPLPSNPVRSIRLPSAGKARDKRLNTEIIVAFWGAVTKARAWYVRPLITLAIETGMRRGELLALKWADINFKTGVAFLPITKNGSTRTVPLTAKALSILTCMKRIDDNVVFPVTIFAVRQAWLTLLKRAGIADFRFHDLRHEAISRFFELGLSVPEVSLISGHRDARMLFRYTHLKAEDVAKKLHGVT